MPEICEVCLTSQFLSKHVKGKYVKNVSILGGRYKTHKSFLTPEFIKNLPMKITKVDSKGKFMWFELKNKNKYYILNRFGLTGHWSLEILPHSNVEFELVSGEKFYFSDPRNFGTITITDNVNVLNKELDKMTIDLLKSNITYKEFKNNYYKLLRKKLISFNLKINKSIERQI